MRRGFERTMQVLLWGVGVTIVWAALALTGWGRQRSPLGAGPGYLDAVTPLTYVAGALLVSVSSTLLVQTAASARKRRTRRQRTRPAARPAQPPHTAVRIDPVSPQVARGRTGSDLPANPPVAGGDGPSTNGQRDGSRA